MKSKAATCILAVLANLCSAAAIAADAPPRARVLVPEALDASSPRYESVSPSAASPAHFIARAKHVVAFARANPATGGDDRTVAGIDFWPVTPITREGLRIFDVEGDEPNVQLRTRALECSQPAPAVGKRIKLDANAGGLTIPIFLSPEANAVRYLELSLDHPGEPVMLSIVGYDGVAVRITPSSRTTIASVHVQTYYPSLVVGVDPAKVTQQYQGCKVRAAPSAGAASVQSQSVPSKEEQYSTRGLKGFQLAIGAPQPVRRDRPLLGNFYDPEMPAPNSYGIAVLNHLGYIRPAKVPPHALPERAIKPYEVLKVFRMPQALAGGHSVTFIANTPEVIPSGDIMHSMIVRPIRK